MLSLLESSAAVVASVVVVARFSVAFASRAASVVVIFVVAMCIRGPNSQYTWNFDECTARMFTLTHGLRVYLSLIHSRSHSAVLKKSNVSHTRNFLNV